MPVSLRTSQHRISQLLRRSTEDKGVLWDGNVNSSVHRILEWSLSHEKAIDIYQAFHDLILFLKKEWSSDEEIAKIVRRQIDNGFYFFFTNANLQEAKTFRWEYFATQRIIRAAIDAINPMILNEGTDIIRARSIYHLKLLWIQSNLEWIANPENNDFIDDFEKRTGKEFRDFCEDIQGLLLIVSLVNKDPGKSSGPEDMSINALDTVINSLEKLTLTIRTFWVALSTKNTGVAGRKMICAVSEFICDEARKIRVILDEIVHHESLKGTKIKDILLEKKRELDFAYSVQLIILSHHENIDSPESLEHVLEKIREWEAVMNNSEIDRLNAGIMPDRPNRYTTRFTHAASINAAIATGIYARVCEDGETRTKHIVEQECTILSHLSQYNVKNTPKGAGSEFTYMPGADNQKVFTQYCIDRIEHSTQKEEKLNENEKDALRILLILNQFSRSIEIPEIEKLIRAGLRQLSNIQSITVMDVEILIYALENITDFGGESSLETIRFLESFLINHRDRLTIAPAFSRLYLLMAVFLAKHTKLSTRSAELYAVLKHLENYRTYVNNDIEYRNQAFMLRQIENKFYADNGVDPKNPVAKLLWESEKEGATHAYELETSHTISQIISPSNKQITLTVTKDQQDREKKEDLQRILSRELFLGTCEILIHPIEDSSWRVAMDPVRIWEETVRIISEQICGPTEFIRPLVIDSFLIIFRGKKASRKLFTKILEKHETDISTVIRAYSSKVVQNHLAKAQAREAELIKKELESAIQDDDTKLPNLKALQQKLSKDPEKPTSLIFMRIVSPVDLYNPEIKRKIAKSIEKRLQITLAIRKIHDPKLVPLYQIDGQTFVLDITKIRTDSSTAPEIIRYFLNNQITELASTQCLYGYVQQAPAALAIQHWRIALDKVVSNPQFQSHETTAADLDQFETEMRLAELIKEFTKDYRNVQPNYQAIADYSISQEPVLSAKKLEILFGMKKDSTLAEFIREHNAKVTKSENYRARVGTESILRIAKSCGEYPRITQLMIEAALRQMQTTEEEISVLASSSEVGTMKLGRPEHGYDFSVNISADDLLDRNFARNTIELLNKFGYTSSRSIRRITFEIIESPLDPENDIIINNLLELKSHGCIFAIDDFGKEHSNHSRTTELGELLGYDGEDSTWAIAFIKIDSFFVKDIHTKKPNQASVIGMIAQAKEIWWENFANHVVVEWIEKTHDAELAWFRAQWINLFQWWRFSTPSQLACEGTSNEHCAWTNCGHHPWCKMK